MIAKVLIWLCYIIGGVLSMWKRASLSADNRFTPWMSVEQYVKGHAPQLMMNFLLSTALFWTWWNDPTLLGKVLSYVGLQTEAQLPLNHFTAALYGVFSDQVMDFILAKIHGKFPTAIPITLPSSNEPKG